jgi:hypothetical protein
VVGDVILMPIVVGYVILKHDVVGVYVILKHDVVGVRYIEANVVDYVIIDN